MPRYRLDDLGWYQFEKLVQSVLKAEIGLGVESWGGRGDYGRDAYFRGPLRFPARSEESSGPFLFQMKFIGGASAAGADWRNGLLASVRAEVSEIRRRQARGIWHEVRRYILICNCPLTGASRNEIEATIREPLPETEVFAMGSDDVSDWLDSHEGLRRSFPEILGIRDLLSLVEGAVNKAVREVSRLALAEATELAPVFVQTGAYHQARRVLSENAFVVLDGPPEMGKTAIARMLGIVHLLDGRQVVECRKPDDFFNSLDQRADQLFIADDAFGRTEYDPGLGRQWERDLARVLRALDARHGLVWTTRRHILSRALKDMDLTGKASAFPDPAEVVVTASELSVEEKALILYRHAKAARLDTTLASIVRANAPSIVGNPHFTPERIRRFVTERLATLADIDDDDVLISEVASAIRNPTQQMRRSYSRLPNIHRWILISLLELESPEVPELQERFQAHRGEIAPREFAESLDDLIGTFVRVGLPLFDWEERSIEWIHPSYRDLVIDELSASADEQERFLRRASVAGTKLAISEAGGPAGERQSPLLATERSFNALDRRWSELASEVTDEELGELLEALAQRTRVASDALRARFRKWLRTVYRAALDRWTVGTTPASMGVLESFVGAYAILGEDEPEPNLEPTWIELGEHLCGQSSTDLLSDPEAIELWDDIADLALREDLEFTRGTAFRNARAAVEDQIFETSSGLSAWADAEENDPEENDAEARRFQRLARALEQIDRDGQREDVVSHVEGLAEEHAMHGVESNSIDDDYERGPSSSFDITSLFADL